jgi:hypothetical protein
VPERFFTPAEARAALDEVRGHTERLVAARADQLAARARLFELTTIAQGNGHKLDGEHVVSVRAEVERAEAELAESLAALEEIGVVVKDIDAGLVDFPSLREGEEVFLCWQLGEPDVMWWHGRDAGFRGRKPI